MLQHTHSKVFMSQEKGEYEGSTLQTLSVPEVLVATAMMMSSSTAIGNTAYPQ